MILIAHRGNINGPDLTRENHPDYIDLALIKGYNVEIDLWTFSNKFFLGHDEPQYEISFAYLRQRGLWIHCKHYNSFQRLIPTDLNFFYHTNEDYVLTNHGFIWAYPGNPGSKYTICVMPEQNNSHVKDYAGVCSDYIGEYDNAGNKKV